MKLVSSIKLVIDLEKIIIAGACISILSWIKRCTTTKESRAHIISKGRHIRGSVLSIIINSQCIIECESFHGFQLQSDVGDDTIGFLSLFEVLNHRNRIH